MHAGHSFKPLFSLPDGLHYLNCAYMAPLSRRVAEAGHRALDRLGAPSRIQVSDFFDPCDDVRERFARLVNVTDPQRIRAHPVRVVRHGGPSPATSKSPRAATL